MIETERNHFDGVSDQSLKDTRMAIEESTRQLKNLRAREGSLGQTVAVYGVLLARAREIVASAPATLAASLKYDARTLVKPGFKLPSPLAEALWLVEDDQGPRLTLLAINEGEYPGTEESYRQELAEKQKAIAEILVELARREASRTSAAAEAEYSRQVAQIGGD